MEKENNEKKLKKDKKNEKVEKKQGDKRIQKEAKELVVKKEKTNKIGIGKILRKTSLTILLILVIIATFGLAILVK